jgi:hypothetical protein
MINRKPKINKNSDLDKAINMSKRGDTEKFTVYIPMKIADKLRVKLFNERKKISHVFTELAKDYLNK